MEKICQVTKIETLKSQKSGKEFSKITYLLDGEPFRSMIDPENLENFEGPGEYTLRFRVVPDKFLSPGLRLIGIEK